MISICILCKYLQKMLAGQDKKKRKTPKIVSISLRHKNDDTTPINSLEKAIKEFWGFKAALLVEIEL